MFAYWHQIMLPININYKYLPHEITNKQNNFLPFKKDKTAINQIPVLKIKYNQRFTSWLVVGNSAEKTGKPSPFLGCKQHNLPTLNLVLY